MEERLQGHQSHTCRLPICGTRAIKLAMPAAYLALLVLHFLALALGVGASFAMFTLGLASRDLNPAERARFMIRAMAVSKSGSYGFVLLVVTGLGMFFMRGPSNVLAVGGPAFHAKLTLVVIMAFVLGYGQALRKRVRDASGGPSMSALRKVSIALPLLGIAIVTAAVIAFQ
jgi:uncharacterized membrane protein